MACHQISHCQIQSLWRTLFQLGSKLKSHGNSLSSSHFQKLHPICPLSTSLNRGYCRVSQPNNNNNIDTDQVLRRDVPPHTEIRSPNIHPSSGRLMLIDGTSIIYRAYYRLLAKLHHGHLSHADGNGDWVLTIFTALSLIIDVLEFIPSHVTIKRINQNVNSLVKMSRLDLEGIVFILKYSSPTISLFSGGLPPPEQPPEIHFFPMDNKIFFCLGGKSYDIIESKSKSGTWDDWIESARYHMSRLIPSSGAMSWIYKRLMEAMGNREKTFKSWKCKDNTTNIFLTQKFNQYGRFFLVITVKGNDRAVIILPENAFNEGWNILVSKIDNFINRNRTTLNTTVNTNEQPRPLDHIRGEKLQGDTIQGQMNSEKH
ncbi:hypothetical protein CQW23_07257 [Capsicum baccatum]|uniref:5'-3' exonuclease alpha-helical arch N-terminal domain-containing protein n=1 Tax=Capsicum baccatum TaxID=33114 RepID=A0A2G2X5L3_CAPBA|nr:hypothetical protein CQW23_07257 [Capsicum baccatum]